MGEMIVNPKAVEQLNSKLTTLTDNVFNSGTLTDQLSVDDFILTIMNTLGVGQSGGFKITVPGTDTFYCFMSRIATSEGYGYYHRSTLNDAHFVRYNNGIITKKSITTT